MKKIFSPLKLQLDKTNSSMITVVAVASAMSVFFIVSTISLNSKRSYQHKVINVKQKAVKQLKSNLKEIETLKVSYQEFINKDPNVIGGIPKGSGEKDGDNAKIILDSLPSKYDFPALTTSLEKLMTKNNHQIISITGTDDEIAQTLANNGQIVEIPFSITVKGTSKTIGELVKTLELSIRPIKINSIDLSGQDSQLQATISGVTYYQPSKTMTIKKEVVK